MACNISLEIYWWGLQFCFRFRLNLRFSREVMGPQSRKSLNFDNFGTPERKCHLDVGLMKRRRIYYKGEGGGFPQIRAMVSLVSSSCPWLVLTPKMFQLCINHLVLVSCKPVWVNEACQFFLVPSQSSNMPLYPSKVLRARERALTFCSSIVFYWDSHLSPSRSWERVRMFLILLYIDAYNPKKIA